jgi:flavin-dependent dehydrogenase
LTSISAELRVDVAVIGAGPAGSAAALHLARNGWSVLLVDTGETRAARGETLLPAARLALERLGVWDTFEQAGHPVCAGGRALWGGPEETELRHVFDPYGPARFIDRARFDADLRTAAAAAGAQVKSHVRVRPEGRAADGARVFRLEDGTDESRVHARYVFDATGRRATFARCFGARRIHVDALACALMTLAPQTWAGPSGETFVEACSLGWWYRAVDPAWRMTVALFSDIDLLKASGATRTAGWSALYGESQGAHELPLSATDLTGTPAVTSAAVGHLSQVWGDGWIAAGDAALTLDPLAARGVTAALVGGLHAATALSAHDAGLFHSLAQYGRMIDRVFDQHLVSRAGYYGRETRFAEFPFWRRRATLSSTA